MLLSLHFMRKSFLMYRGKYLNKVIQYDSPRFTLPCNLRNTPPRPKLNIMEVEVSKDKDSHRNSGTTI